MIALVCGGRGYAGPLEQYLDELHAVFSFTMVIHGAARGADLRAGNWAAGVGLHSAAVPALWGQNGKSAGPKRNAVMLLLKPDLCIAFPGGTGTTDMIARCKRAGVPVYQPCEAGV